MSAAEEKARAEVDAFFDDADMPDAPAEDLVGEMARFVKTYEKTLHDMQEAVSETMSETWDAMNDPIMLLMAPYDRDVLMKMISTDNQQLNKVVKVFAALRQEIDVLELEAERKFYAPLTMFGHTSTDDEDDLDGYDDDDETTAQKEGKTKDSPEVQMGKFLPFLQDLCNLVNRAYDVTRNLINQIACLYHQLQNLHSATFKNVHLECVYESLGKLLRVLLTLDTIIADNANIQRAWSLYKRMIKYVRSNPDRYDADDERLRVFEGLLLQLEQRVLSGRILAGCLHQDMGLVRGTTASKTLVSGNKIMYDEFTFIVTTLQKRYTMELNETVESFSRNKLVELACLYAIYRRLFEATSKPDKKLYRKLWDTQQKIPIVHLYGRSIWFMADFLVRYAPLETSGLKPKPAKVESTRRDLLRKMDLTFQDETEAMYLNVCMWMVRIESELVATERSNISAVVNARAKLLLRGILLANKIRNMVLAMLNMHLALREAFVSRNIRAISVCVEMLKAIQFTYHRRSKMIAENISHMLGQTTFTLKRIFHPIKKKLEKARRPNAEQLDVLASTNLGLQLLDCTPTADRRNALEIVLSIAQLKNMLRQKHQDEVRYQLWKLNLLADWQKIVRSTCSCDFLYWVTDLVPAFLDDVWQNPDQVNRMQYLFAGLRDCAPMLRSVEHQENKTEFLNAFKAELMGYLEGRILDPLCRQVETNLRLHIHSVVLAQASLRRKGDVKDLSRFIQLKPFNFFDEIVDIRNYVTHYLDTMFYNLTTVTLHDWRIYAEMRNLAHEMYGLDMTEVHLPGHSHYQDGLDVLEIMRNIHIFVARYAYNMNTQIFVERAFDQKHLHTINVDHITNSIRTHGAGIMDTTVNFTYQFLVRKFSIFSEFLFDDHIKSRLMKDIRFFKNEREKLDNKFPYVRAEKFNRAIRKLGVTDEGATFLDQFRQQITEIGNALAYVRMVRSGGLQQCSDSIRFVPDLSENVSFKESVSAGAGIDGADELDEKQREMLPELSAETKAAAANLDNVLQDLSKNFAEGTEYFQVLVNVFQAVFRGEKQQHLRNFYIITPPLMLNFVERTLQQKEALRKKGGRAEAAFSDDGFALGVAYILRLLDQDELFDSLHWFDSANDVLDQRLAALSKQAAGTRNNEDKQHMQLSAKRLAKTKHEFELLFYSLSGARIFFNDTLSKAKSSGGGGDGNDGGGEEKKEESTAGGDGGGAVPAAPPAPPAGNVPAAPPVGNVPPAPPAPPVASFDAGASAGIPPAPPLGTVPPAPPVPMAPPLPGDIGGII
eukprot:TRINITY_DN67306_c3_g4_i3.p1 TRINITY_DN67306_c3_g4~~TRINITY_DN67306_c3_g4_i3.p1  ORF type:complete len:1284 (+),score=789.38 TRINITY_DN67306_c3_g4_i3:263-4114(+)